MKKKKEEKMTLAQQVDKLKDDVRRYLDFYNPEEIMELLENIESSFLNLEEEINFITTKEKIQKKYEDIKKKVDKLDEIDEFKNRLDSLQAEIEKAYSKMTPEEIGNSKDVKFIPKDLVEKINSLINNINVEDIKQKASEVFEKYEIAKKGIDAKAEQQRLNEMAKLEAKVREAMLSKKDNDEWGYVYRNDDGKITYLAPGTKKEVDLGNKYGICYEEEYEIAKYCFCCNGLKEENLNPEQEFAIQKEKEIREKQLKDYKENPDKYSEIYTIPAIVKSTDIFNNFYGTLKVDVHVTKGELIEAGLNPDRLVLQRESVSCKDIAESTKKISGKLRNGLKNALNKLKNIGKDDKNNDDRDDK